MTIDELLAENKQLRAENAELKQRLADLETVVQNLKEQLEAALRAGKRQATPFSKGSPKAKPKKPGRKPGHPAAHRAVPDHVDRVAEATLPATCPDCAGPVLEDAVQVQYQEDIPRPVPTIVTQFNVHIGHCAQCQRRIQGRHADSPSESRVRRGHEVFFVSLCVLRGYYNACYADFWSAMIWFDLVGGTLTAAETRQLDRRAGWQVRLLCEDGS
jgi:hypothetical protein